MRAGERASAVGKPARLFVDDVVVFAVAMAAASVQHEAAGWESSGGALTCGLVRASNTGT